MSTNIKLFRYGRDALIVGVVVLATVLVWRAQVPAKQMSPPGVQANISKAGPPVAARSRSQESSKPTPAVIDYRKSLAEAHSYWDFAHRVLPAAKSGNADAQFYLSRALERCEEDNSMYFQRRGQKIGLDEGLQYAVKRHLQSKSHSLCMTSVTNFSRASQQSWAVRLIG